MNEIKKLQAVFQTLSDYNRLVILKSLSEKESSVGEIVNITRLSQPLVSHHLKMLRNNNFLDTKRNGPFVYYFLRDPRILYAIDLFLEIFKDANLEYGKEFRFCSERMIKKFKKI